MVGGGLVSELEMVQREVMCIALEKYCILPVCMHRCSTEPSPNMS